MKEFYNFWKRQKNITIFLSIGMVLICVLLNLIILFSREHIPFVLYCCIMVILLTGFVINIYYYRFFCRAAYSFSIHDRNVIFGRKSGEKVFPVSDCKEIKFYSQWVKFKFSNETIYLINFISAKNVIFNSPQISVRIAKQIFTSAIIQF